MFTWFKNLFKKEDKLPVKQYSVYELAEEMLWEKIDSHIKSSKKINAIKAYRAFYKVGLKEAKISIDKRADQLFLQEIKGPKTAGEFIASRIDSRDRQ